MWKAKKVVDCSRLHKLSSALFVIGIGNASFFKEWGIQVTFLFIYGWVKINQGENGYAALVWKLLFSERVVPDTGTTRISVERM